MYDERHTRIRVYSKSKYFKFGDPGTDDHRQNIRAAAFDPETSAYKYERKAGWQAICSFVG